MTIWIHSTVTRNCLQTSKPFIPFTIFATTPPQAVRKVPFRKSLRVVYYRWLPYLYIFFEYAILREFIPRFRINMSIEMDIFLLYQGFYHIFNALD